MATPADNLPNRLFALFVISVVKYPKPFRLDHKDHKERKGGAVFSVLTFLKRAA